MSNKVAIIVSLVCLVLLTLPLAITSIVLGSTSPGSCDYTDKMGLNVGQYLLGLGISSLIACVILIMCNVAILCEVTVAAIAMTALSILTVLFGLAWFIIGAIILFRGNIDCIKNGSSHVIYALVLWCISALQCFTDCCSTKHHSNNDA